MENVTLNPKEQARLKVLNSPLAEQMTAGQAAELMGVSTRHARRMLAAYRKKGVTALAHGHRGRPPANATPETIRAEVLRLVSTRYVETNHTHLGELLGEREGIDIDEDDGHIGNAECETQAPEERPKNSPSGGGFAGDQRLVCPLGASRLVALRREAPAVFASPLSAGRRPLR